MPSQAFQNDQTLGWFFEQLYTKAFFLATDTSAYGVGAILSQEGELNPRTQKQCSA